MRGKAICQPVMTFLETEGGRDASAARIIKNTTVDEAARIVYAHHTADIGVTVALARSDSAGAHATRHFNDFLALAECFHEGFITLYVVCFL